MFLLFLHVTEAATSICSLENVLITCIKKTLPFFQWLWLLNIINFIIKQRFAKHPFLKNTSAWLLLKSKFCYHKVRILQKYSVKWWVSLKLWNNHLRDCIHNSPTISWAYNLIPVCQITRLLLENAIMLSKTKLCNGSKTENRSYGKDRNNKAMLKILSSIWTLYLKKQSNILVIFLQCKFWKKLI